MKNIGAMLKEAQKMQQKMTDLQEKLSALEIEGEAAAGRVRVVLSGQGETKSVSIDPALIAPDDAEMLEDLVRTAFNDANAKRAAAKKEMMSDITGGLPLPPGMQLPF